MKEWINVAVERLGSTYNAVEFKSQIITLNVR